MNIVSELTVLVCSAETYINQYYEVLMRSYFLIFSLFVVTALSAQSSQTKVCDIAANAAQLDGKVVQLKGTVISGFDVFVIEDSSCPQAKIWLDYPEGSKAKSGPVARMSLQLAKNSPGNAAARDRAPIKLDKNKDFKQFDSALATLYKGTALCLGCGKFNVSATFVGRLDAVANVGESKDGSGKFTAVSGFGNMNRYPLRLVLQSVSDVTTQEIDYAKAASLPATNTGDGGGDPVAATHQAAKAFAADSVPGQQVAEAANAFGAPGEDNGVEVSFGPPNEVPATEALKGKSNSPDGLLLYCTFDMDRLKGNALAMAIAHVGSHIADIRGAKSDSSLQSMEAKGWVTTLFSAMANQTKSLILPGGFIAWNSSWSAADRSKAVNEAIEAEVQR